MKLSIIPDQHTGGHSTTRFSRKIDDIPAARILYKTASENLLNVNEWHQLAGPSTASFSVITNEGHESRAPVKEGNFIRITIPAVPGAAAGEGYDWVRVEKISKEDSDTRDYTAIRVRPAIPPFYDKKEVAHFFTRDATSTFCVERKGRKVTAAVYGRNEKPNLKVNTFLNKLRNLVVAAGALIGLNKPQWKSLVKGLLQHPPQA